MHLKWHSPSKLQLTRQPDEAEYFSRYKIAQVFHSSKSPEEKKKYNK